MEMRLSGLEVCVDCFFLLNVAIRCVNLFCLLVKLVEEKQVYVSCLVFFCNPGYTFWIAISIQRHLIFLGYVLLYHFNLSSIFFTRKRFLNFHYLMFLQLLILIDNRVSILYAIDQVLPQTTKIYARIWWIAKPSSIFLENLYVSSRSLDYEGF